MNFIAIILFFVFFETSLILGISILNYLNPKQNNYLNKSIFIGESLLLGSSALIACMVFLSMLGLYKGILLWAIVLTCYATLVIPQTREGVEGILKNIRFDIPLIVFLVLLLVFIFRNSYFLVDVDSMRNYLHTQKIWLETGSSIVQDNLYGFALYLPQFDAIPYALGLAVYPGESLFPQLIGMYWRLIVFFLLFGYTSYIYNRYYGLAAVMLVMFNDHIFYSGVNQAVIINGAIVALLFASAYNFWQARQTNSVFRFVLALMFLTQVLPNKYQGLIPCVVIFLLGCLLQADIKGIFKKIMTEKSFIIAICVALFSALLWNIKNIIATGDPLFPAFAGALGAGGWSKELAVSFKAGYGGLSPTTSFKYLTYLFIWPGMMAAKYVCGLLVISPMLFLLYSRRKSHDANTAIHFSYWMCLSVFALIGICVMAHWDPRYYRYLIAIMAFAAISGVHFTLTQCFGIKNKTALISIILLMSVLKIQIIYAQGSSVKRPTMKENIQVLTNKIKTDYAIAKHYPSTPEIQEAIKNQPELAATAAYDFTALGKLPLFALPTKPVVGLYKSTIIKFSSYDSADKIVNDLETAGIDWIIVDPKKHGKVFMPIAEFAQNPVDDTARNPKKLYYNYSFPEELRATGL